MRKNITLQNTNYPPQVTQWGSYSCLWVKSRHSVQENRCPLYPKSGYVQDGRDVRFVPKADILMASDFDLVSPKA